MEYLKELRNICHDNDLPVATIWPEDQGTRRLDLSAAAVLFMPSISEQARNHLLKRSDCVVYTPQHEHFGIAPIEAMISGTPVVAINSGGPCETVIDAKTGYLCAPEACEMGARVLSLLDGSVDARGMGRAAQEHALENFSLERFGEQLEMHLL